MDGAIGEKRAKERKCDNFAERTVGKAFERVHAYIFYAIRTSISSGYSDEWKDCAAIVILSLAAMLLALALAEAVEATSGQRFLPELNGTVRLIVFALYVAVLASNYFLLLHRRKWLRFKKDFDHQSKSLRIAGRVLVWVVLISIPVSLDVLGNVASHATR